MSNSIAHAQVQLPKVDPAERVVISADSAEHWKEGVYEVYLLHGHCLVNQGLNYARGKEAVIWIQPGGEFGDPPHKLLVFVEGEVTVDYAPNADEPGKAVCTLRDKSWYAKLTTQRAISLQVPVTDGKPSNLPSVYEHAVAARDPQPEVRPAQFMESPANTGPRVQPLPPGALGGPSTPEAIPTPPPLGKAPPTPGTRRLHLDPRDPALGLQFATLPSPDPEEKIIAISNGVIAVIEGIQIPGMPAPTLVEIQADRVLIWTHGLTSSANAQEQSANQPFEIYMEGHVVFKEGDRTIEAEQMYFDARRHAGTVLAAELRTPLGDLAQLSRKQRLPGEAVPPPPGYEGMLKLKARAIRILDDSHFIADTAAVTTSRFGVPGYELKSGQIEYFDHQEIEVNPVTGQPQLDPLGEQVVRHRQFASSNNNFLYFEDVPVFYWPRFAAELEKPNYFIDRIRLRQDKIFGFQAGADVDAFQLFGIRNRPEGTRWDISGDELTKRGFGFGTDFSYNRQDLFGLPGTASGLIDAWGIKDHGTDNLGADRRSLVPEKDWRGRILGRHRQTLPDGYVLSAELGYVSDRNFLEQFYEHEWDDLKDLNTGIELKQYQDNRSWSVSADLRLNEFWTDTNQLPRLDHFWIGESLVNDRLTWFEHSTAGYYQMRLATDPINVADSAKFTKLPWEANEEGGRFSTKHEFDLPVNLGPVKFVPYALGELDHWGAGLDDEDKNRAYGQVGARASYMMWTADPEVASELLNLNGLAHKVTYDLDVSYSRSSLAMNQLPLYDPIDDNNIETFRRRFAFDTFGAPALPQFPAQFDPRLYALRSGLAGDVTSPSVEIADNMLAARAGLRQRWQTKRGGPATQKIIDYITLDTEVVFFPDPNRDNFGQTVGLADYAFSWNLGDRVTAVSDGMMDFFNQGPRYVSAGLFVTRPPRGALYTGIRSMEGPISSTVLTSSYAYRMSEKWVTTFNSSYGISKGNRNIGQAFTLTRIGESFLVSFGVNVDASKGNFGTTFAIEPRFLPGRRLGTVGGLVVPPAGAYGLE